MNFTRPQIVAMLEFEGADYWAPQGAERFGSKTAVEVINEYLENEPLLHASKDIPSFLKENPTWWTFTAYKRQVVDPRYHESWAESMAEQLRENFAEEHGDYDDGDDGLSDEDFIELKRRTRETVDWYLTKAKVFPCEHLRNFTLDADDILEVVQQMRPQWLLESV